MAKPPVQVSYGFPAPTSPSGAGGAQPATIIAQRNPATTDTGYNLGQLWDNKVLNLPWILTSVAGGNANWVLMGSGAGALNTINSVAAVLGNINLTSTGGSITITPGVGTINLEAVGGGGGVTSITGTANQIAASSPTGAVTLSLVGPYTPSTYTAFGVLFGNGTSSIGATAVGTAGQVLTSNGAGVAPTFQAAGGGGSINITPNTGTNVTNTTFSLLGTSVAAAGIPLRSNGTAANSIQLEVQRTSAQASSSAANAGIASFTNTQFSSDANGFVSLAGPYTAANFSANGILIGQGTSPIVSITPLTDGQLVIGRTGLFPVPGNLTSTGGTITVTGGVGTLNVDVVGSMSGTTTTVGAVTGDVITFPIPSGQVASFDVLIVGNDAAGTLGMGYSLFACARNPSGTAILVGVPDLIVNEDGADSAAGATLIVSGANAIVQVTGVTGKTINWKATARIVNV